MYNQNNYPPPNQDQSPIPPSHIPPGNSGGQQGGGLGAMVRAPGLLNVRNAAIAVAILAVIAVLAIVLNPDSRSNPVAAAQATNGDKLNSAMYRVESQTTDQQDVLQEFQDDLVVVTEQQKPVESGNVPNRRIAVEQDRPADSDASEDEDETTDESEDDTEENESEESDAAEEDKAEEEPATLRDHMNNILGNRRSSNQMAAERLFNRWEPRYEAARVGHDSLVKRVESTRKYWSMYEREQQDLINRMEQGSVAQQESSEDLANDRDLWLKWDEQAAVLLDKSDAAMTQLEHMDARIKFQRNRADFHAIITDADGQEISRSVSSLIDSLSEFNADTATLRNSINSG